MDNFMLVFKREDGSYVDIECSLVDEAVYSIKDDDYFGGYYFDVLYEPKFNYETHCTLDDKELRKLKLKTEEMYWDHVEDNYL